MRFFIVQVSPRGAIAAGDVILAVRFIADFLDFSKAQDLKAGVPELGFAIMEAPLYAFENGGIAASGQHTVVGNIPPLCRNQGARGGGPKGRAAGGKPRRANGQKTQRERQA